MIELLEILFLSVVQGIGEFLPISSSGHLVVVDEIYSQLGHPFSENSDQFIKLNVALHVGTLLAVLIVFRNRIFRLLGTERRLIPLLIAGTIPAVGTGLFIKKAAPWLCENLIITSLGFALTGILLLTTMRMRTGEKNCADMTLCDAILIGLMQAFAILPGLSRSGATIVGGLFCRLKREEAATYAFLLSIPVIAGGGLLEVKELLHANQTNAESIYSFANIVLLFGLLTSCVVGIVSLTWLINWLQKGKIWYFAIWVFIMMPVALALNFTAHQEKNEKIQYNADQKIAKDDIQSEKIILPSESLAEAIKNEKSDRQLMNREEAQKEYERILAEEEAKEQALIDMENKRVPLVDRPESLVQLFPDDRIWLSADGKSVVLLGNVALRDGLLELFACRVGSKEHESVVSVRLLPQTIHAALLAVGAEPGKPVQITPVFVPPSGDEIEIKIRWMNENGVQKEMLAQNWIWDAANSPKEAKKPMQSHWIFSGSLMLKNEDGDSCYLANETGELFGVSNFVGSILDVPIQSSAENNDLLFACFTENIPET
ncbi:MAG: undecaprenyl-diphosphate phosphatase, partial [Thermoguttaceae bacterium]